MNQVEQKKLEQVVEFEFAIFKFVIFSYGVNWVLNREILSCIRDELTLINGLINAL